LSVSPHWKIKLEHTYYRNVEKSQRNERGKSALLSLKEKLAKDRHNLVEEKKLRSLLFAHF
jgi:hypothetical protein